ncbi:hypothetical protein BC936DRAFT_147980 [Jimgerdemannia flammicorona]|uniref:Uncharacterized protein n=1 Tax=Jimgerdemannia flammicorona TaxID=994334 RepID=A0A433DKS6_9FUNG|nr:hypothetical protein BC936DRAFT_147980 [Jimgerdemannia flammicorona]
MYTHLPSGPSVSRPNNYSNDQNIQMLNNNEFVPEPRAKFLDALRNVDAGQSIVMPSLGQDPKHFKEGYQGRTFFITQQMIDMWRMLSADQQQQQQQLPLHLRIGPRSIKRVLSGPMGVGKSYLALFLAAKAYAENWPVLYISDAADIDRDEVTSSIRICQLFLSINRDILTAAEFRELIGNRTKGTPLVVSCAYAIFGNLLLQKSRKTLLVVDEHGVLFNSDPPAPERLPVLRPLMNLTAWREDASGARVVLTGTAHAKFERKHLVNGMNDWVEFVGPLPENTFDSLLRLHPFLGRPAIAPKVKKIVNCVPRELMYLDKHMKDSTGNYISEATVDKKLRAFRKDRGDAFLKAARNYFESLDAGSKTDYRRALSNMFLRWSDIEHTISFDWKFLDTGLVYRFKDEYSYVKYKYLCPAALDALLEVYATFPLPRDVSVTSLIDGRLTGNNFEEILFQQLVKYRDIPFKATDLNGSPTTDVHIRFRHFISLEKDQFTPGAEHAQSLVRGYAGYPRFDFMVGRIFIQVSVSTFDKRNEGSASINKAFTRPYNSDPNQNQIEVYLNAMFGPGHKADINDGRFVVTQNGLPVPDFRIVYIRGNLGSPRHLQLVRRYRDVAFVDYEELKTKLFGDFLK